ncbi:peptidase C15, pyroglutamyl peptidase I-like protein [Myriangium duriaei CBS 260.36]|uniref:Peptidase C15, pyroglutamyl peptidase I-like protein n=1 Tax=Myriangium duriaei CBS 260.36 TaxID=1168546 RepID=A0A9P4MIX5_9PEZI|nr:peptidase C15, pyroglutamyl peptidase I-like protein [Myriangium duriaei CBS 260.36]
MPPTPTFKVFITGFGPFPDGRGGHFSRNASHEVTRLLPSSLPPHSPSNPGPTSISLLNPTADDGAHLRTEYAYIRSYCQALHSPSPSPNHPDLPSPKDVDLYLHIGMAAGWDFVSVERVAFRQDFTSSWSRGEKGVYYSSPDDAGRTAGDAGQGPWGSLPVGLGTMVDVDRCVVRAREVLGKDGIEVKAHVEAGEYCCGFVYYESLANRTSRGQKRNVMFCHVPGELDERSLERARDAIVAVIVAAAEQMV